jgi:glycerol transport system permease protein
VAAGSGQDEMKRTQGETVAAFGRPWLLLAPALAVMLLSAVAPLCFVLFYSVHDTFAGNNFIFVGAEWYRAVLSSSDFLASAVRSLLYCALVLAVEIPLGLYVALRMPPRGALASFYLVAMAIPLLAPSIVVGYLWKVLALPGAGLLPAGAALFGLSWDMNSTVVTWLTLLLMDAWRWTSLVALLAYAGLSAIPAEHYQAARIDGAGNWAIFRHIQLPRLRLVLAIAVLLRFMDSLMIYTEAYVVTRGGPGVSTTFLSHELVQTATIQFDLGEGAAMSVIYFAIVLAVSWAFFRVVAPPRTGGSQS